MGEGHIHWHIKFCHDVLGGAGLNREFEVAETRVKACADLTGDHAPL